MDFYEPVDPRRRRRWIGPTVFIASFLALIITAAFMAEYLARDAAAGIVAKPVMSALGVTSSDDVAVDFGSGSLILQAISGSLDEVTLDVASVPVGELSTTVRLVATGVPLDTAGIVEGMTAIARMDAASLSSLTADLTTQPLTVRAVEGTLLFNSTLDVAGEPSPIELEVTPTVSEGMLMFRVIGMTVAGEDVVVDDALSGVYGAEVAAAATPPSMCVAQLLPAALVISKASVRDGALVLEAAGKRIPLSGEGFTTRGHCAGTGDEEAITPES